MDIQSTAQLIAVPLGVAVFVITELLKVVGVKNKDLLRTIVVLLAVVLGVANTYSAGFYNVLVTIISTLGVALTAYHIVWKPAKEALNK